MQTFNLVKSGVSVLTIFLLFLNISAHLVLSTDELSEYHANLKRNGEALSHCLRSPEMAEHNIRMLVHRDRTLGHLRKARGINVEATPAKRDGDAAAKWAASDHEQSSGQSTDPQDLFNFHWDEEYSPNTVGCALTPHSLYGPYWIEGQPERQDIRADQSGIYLRLAMQVIDITTCKPISGAQVDVWQANAMGHYSTDKSDFLRGWQRTSEYGTVDFDTNFPGHYYHRASHIHVLVRAPGEERVVNFGQIYFDQHLRDRVEATDRYRGNDQENFSNLKDSILPYDASDVFDPFVRWATIGSDLEEPGLLAWITLGVNSTDRDMPQPLKRKRNLVDFHLR